MENYENISEYTKAEMALDEKLLVPGLTVIILPAGGSANTSFSRGY
jgi:hypothetical protein